MYRCQSALKLIELNDRYGLFQRYCPHTVVDLAAAPGGFAQVSLEIMGRLSSSQHPGPSPLVIAVDRRPIDPMKGLLSVRADILQHRQILQIVERSLSHASREEKAARQSVPSWFDDQAERSVDMVLHDGVSVVKGQHAFSVTYAQNQMALSTLLLACQLFQRYGRRAATPSRRTVNAQRSSTHSTRCTNNSSDNGHRSRTFSAPSLITNVETLPVCFVSKVLQSHHFEQVHTATKALFRHVEAHKPRSSRLESLETYLVATDFKLSVWQRLAAMQSPFIASHLATRQPDEDNEKQRRRKTALRCVSAALFSMPPTRQDCGDADRLLWHCLGCGQTCMGCRACSQCGSVSRPTSNAPRCASRKRKRCFE